MVRFEVSQNEVQIDSPKILQDGYYINYVSQILTSDKETKLTYRKRVILYGLRGGGSGGGGRYRRSSLASTARVKPPLG